MTDEPTFQLPADVQIITLFIAIAVLFLIFMGMHTLWTDWRKQWEIEDFIDGYISENADVDAIEDEHPVAMPRRPKWLGCKGWHR